VAVARDRAVDLADRGRGERLLLERREHRRRLLPQLLAQQLLDLLERERRDVVAQRRERLLELLALALRQRGEVDRRQHLTDLHRRAAHLAELLDQLACERGRALTGGGVGALGGAQDVGGAGADPAGRLTGDEPAQAGGARDARRGGLFRHSPSVRRIAGRGPYG
jgi:hypothetical protein